MWNTMQTLPKKNGYYLVTEENRENGVVIERNVFLAEFFNVKDGFIFEVNELIGITQYRNKFVSGGEMDGDYFESELTAWAELPQPFIG